MASAPSTSLPPPPPGSAAPTSPVAASPAPPEASPQLERGSRMTIQVVSGLRTIAQEFPATAPLITQINDLMRQVQMKMMSTSKPGEPAAPPVNG